MSNFYCIYDNMYEEYQMPFVMKNDNVALAEFNLFKQNLINKAETNQEKQRLKIRYFLCKYNDIKYDKETSIIEIGGLKFKPEIFTSPEEDEE